MLTLRFWAVLPALALAFALTACDGDGPGLSPDGGMSMETDEDGDSIADRDEDRVDEIDTDLDGLPDYLDRDSDDDGILDEIEAGDGDLVTGPVDSDGDGTPDFRDADSDDNGLPDAVEGVEDFDGDGRLNFRDLDDDEDGIDDATELDGVFDFPLDFDQDGQPDFRDRDSDNDTILDGQDGRVDSDRDGSPNRHDIDSDGDGLTDAEEAGDADLDTPPVDTDLDRAPDFVDLDSDGDTLGDSDERERGLNPRVADSDEDGVDDFVEVAAGTDALDAEDNPRSRGDFVFIVPFRDDAQPRRDTLDFETDVQFADVYFLFDISGSMSTVINQVAQTTANIVNDLSCEDLGQDCISDGDCETGAECSIEGRCIASPDETGCLASLWTGAGGFAGSCRGCRTRTLSHLSGHPQQTIDSLNSIDTTGGDENHFEALACTADADLCPISDVDANCADNGVGCPGFRGDSVRMTIMFTDEDEECTEGQCVMPNTAAWAGALLRENSIFFVGVNNQPTEPERSNVRADYEALGRASLSLGENGQPIVFDAPRDNVATIEPAVTQAIRDVTQNLPLLVSAEAEDAPDDDGNALVFIDRLEVNTSGVGNCTTIASTADLNTDGFDDAYPSLLPGTPVCWDVVARDNLTVEPTTEPQVFRARIVVRGENSILDARNVWFVVPGEFGDDLLD